MASRTCDGAPSGRHAIGLRQVDEVGKTFGQLARFVVRFAGTGAIAATDQDDAQSGGASPAHEPSGERRFAGSARGQIPDTDHRHVDLLGRFPAEVIGSITRGDGPGVGTFGEA